MAISKLLLVDLNFTKLAWMVHCVILMHSSGLDAESEP